MRQNIIIVLLTVCATLLAGNLYVSLQRPDLPLAFGQAVGVPSGQVAIATSQGTGPEPWCFVYDVTSQRLAVYSCKNQGLELKGVRQCTWDLQLQELPPALASRRIPVADIKKELQKQPKAGATPPTAKEKKEPPGKQAPPEEEPEEEAPEEEKEAK
jgi:hypothetical protein